MFCDHISYMTTCETKSLSLLENVPNLGEIRKVLGITFHGPLEYIVTAFHCVYIFVKRKENCCWHPTVLCHVILLNS
jgi:hypothetical protein